jgi:hypothetical protein
MASDDEAGRIALYDRPGAVHDVYDAPLTVRVLPTAPPFDPAGRPGATAVTVHGWPGVVGPLTDEGTVYGSMVAFADDRGRLVSVEWAELDRDVVALAEQLVPLDATIWSTWVRALSMDNRVDRIAPDAIEVVVAESDDTTPYRLVALVPPDYPLASFDRRRTCARLDINDTPGSVACVHGWWIRAGGHTYVFGVASAGVQNVIVGPDTNGRQPSSTTPVRAKVYSNVGWPNGIYVAELPNDWCWVVVANDDGTEVPGQVGAIDPTDQVSCNATG